MDGAPGARRCELDDAGARRRDVLSPAEPSIELRRALDIRDGDDDDLELLVDRASVRALRGVFGLVRACSRGPPSFQSRGRFGYRFQGVYLVKTKSRALIGSWQG